MNARYRINAGYQIQEIAGEKILIAGQHSEMNFSKMLILNDSAASVILDRKSTRLNSSHIQKHRMPSSA